MSSETQLLYAGGAIGAPVGASNMSAILASSTRPRVPKVRQSEQNGSNVELAIEPATLTQIFGVSDPDVATHLLSQLVRVLHPDPTKPVELGDDQSCSWSRRRNRSHRRPRGTGRDHYRGGPARCHRCHAPRHAPRAVARRTAELSGARTKGGAHRRTTYCDPESPPRQGSGSACGRRTNHRRARWPSHRRRGRCAEGGWGSMKTGPTIPSNGSSITFTQSSHQAERDR